MLGYFDFEQRKFRTHISALEKADLSVPEDITVKPKGQEKRGRGQQSWR